jgi:threonine/homoserine/homoserine lactone efflux protein
MIENSFLLEVLTKCLIANLIWIPVHVLWLYLGVLIKSLELTAKVQKSINYFMAVSMISVVFLAMLTTF